MLGACSVSKHVPEGEYILNKVEVKSDDKSYDASSLKPYVRQKEAPKIFSLFRNPFSRKPVIFDTLQARLSCQDLRVAMQNLGFLQDPVNWRISYQVEFIWECAIGIIVTIPFVTFTVLSGLQSIDTAYYEAATVDGAGFWNKLRHVTLPLVKPSLTVSTVLNIIYVFNSFPIIYTITKGAPANKTDTMVTYLYMLAFYDQRKGPATALSVIGFVILCIVD